MTRKEATKLAEELVSKMTVEEAASQLKYKAPAIPHLNVPEYNWWNEALHGVARAGTATCFPQAIGLGATFDPDMLLEISHVIALETRAKYNAYSSHGDRSQYKGVTMWSPNINIFRDPRWGRGQETFGEDPTLTATLGCAFVNGLQTEVDGYKMTAACAKHFAVHSGPEGLRHEFNAEATPKDLWETYLPAFEACVTEADVEAVMGAYNRTNGEPCCASDALMNKILRDKWQFEGHYVSDCWAIRDFHEHHGVTKNSVESAALALKMGCDVNCGCTYEHLMDAYKKGKVTEKEIRRSAVRLFTTRYLLGLFDRTAMDELPYDLVGCKEHLELAYNAAVNSTVLLKNDGILPLSADKYKTIAVIGPNADSKEMLVGNYFGTPARSITLLEGIRGYCDEHGIRLHYSEGSRLFQQPRVGRPQENYRAFETVFVTENSDLAILCVGLDATLEGEQGDVGNEFASGDRPDLLLPKVQREMIESVAKTGKPYIIINASGSPMDLSAYEDTASAILQVWYPGGEGGRAVADILFGKVSPGGKLPITFYYDHNNLPDITDYHMTGRTYRYITEKPWKPFGYGLTYGNIKIADAQLTNASGDANDNTFCKAAATGVTVSISCKNTSDMTLSDVLQVYVHVNNSTHEVPNSKLAAFKRVTLLSGEEATYEIMVPANAFRVVDDEGARITDGNGATLYVGFCSPHFAEDDTTICRLTLQ